MCRKTAREHTETVNSVIWSPFADLIASDDDNSVYFRGAIIVWNAIA
jgi:hypothetical protein